MELDDSDVTNDSLQVAMHKGQHFRGLVAYWDAHFNTRRYRSVKGLLPPEADVLMPLLHGMGPMSSHAGSMLATLNALTASKKKGGRSESLKALRALANYRLVGGEAIDLPGAHGNPVPQPLQCLDGLCDWIANWFTSIKQDNDVPLVPIARSASAMIVQRVNERQPGLLDGVVLLSPMAPFDTSHSNEDLLRRVEVSQCELNRIAFDYMLKLTTETDWDTLIDPFQELPVLILTGGRDTQVSDRVRKRCLEWSRKLAHVEFANLSEAGHDVFNLRDRVPGRQAFARLYEFLAHVAPIHHELRGLAAASDELR